MRAITLWQPHAGLILLGPKRIETRTWSTDYRGPLAIHAGQRFDDDYWIAAVQAGIVPFKGGVDLAPRECKVRGAIVCVGDLVDCRPMTIEDEKLACCSYHRRLFAWVLGPEVRPVTPPLVCRGYQALWTPEAGSLDGETGFRTKPAPRPKKCDDGQLVIPGSEA